MELAKYNNHCSRCPEKTETPIFDQMAHLHGFPGYQAGGPFESAHVRLHVERPKVIDGEVKEEASKTS